MLNMTDTDASPGGRVALYRFYDAREGLLYAGISNEPWRRRKEHALTQPWYPQVRHQAITWYDTERQARAAETRAIREERPQFNVTGAVRPARARFTIRPVWWANAAGVLLVAPMLMALAVLSVPVPLLRAVLVPGTVVVALVGFAVAFTALAIVSAPQVRRLAAWVERNSIYPERTSGSRG
jgi:hypothetical protein